MRTQLTTFFTTLRAYARRAARAGAVHLESLGTTPRPFLSWLHHPAVRIGGGSVLAVLLYFTLGALFTRGIDDTRTYRPGRDDLPPKASVAVAMVSGILHQELDAGWMPDDPWFYPGAWVDNRPEFQRGMYFVFQHFTLALTQQANSPVDKDLAAALQALNTPPDRWWLGLDWPPVRASTSHRIQTAQTALRRYNARIALGEVSSERRPQALAITLRHLSRALQTTMATLETQGEAHSRDGSGNGIETQADNRFYRVRGAAYASYLLLTALREDYGPVIRARGLGNLWNELLDSLTELLEIDPLIITNGPPGGMLLKNHLMEQGFTLLQARTRLREITEALEK